MPHIASNLPMVKNTYLRTRQNLQAARGLLKRPLSLAEKILFGHLAAPDQDLKPGAFLLLNPDRVVMQDATAQMAILQFAQARIPRVALPATIHCDHFVIAQEGAAKDLPAALNLNKEVYDFLASAAAKYGLGFWKPGSGIIHQVVFENYAYPGGLMIGTDSHTPTAGGLGMLACGVGGADAVDALAGMPWELKNPKIIGVKLAGKLQGWASPKDVILHLLGLLTVKGGTNAVLEYFGEGARTLSCTGKGTITNMGAELGATASLFPFDESMAAFLKATQREDIAQEASANQDLCQADAEVEKDPARFFSQVVEVDLSALKPLLNGPHTPDLSRPLSAMKAEIIAKGYPPRVSAVLVGSCTNSSWEDLGRAAEVAAQAVDQGQRCATPLFISPGSDQVRDTTTRDKILSTLEKAGAVILSNACGPCIGQWKRLSPKSGEPNSIIHSFNRNFPARADGNPETRAFIASPETALALSLSGDLGFDPETDALPSGLRLKAPSQTPALPPAGFVFNDSGFVAPLEDGSRVEVKVAPDSQRLQLLEPFSPWDGKDFLDCPLLLKAKGKCTTDHISPAGKWLRFRGHLDKISDNLLLGAHSAFGRPLGEALNQLDQKPGVIAAVARQYKAQGLKWVVVGDENYGEGSSREHAAMSPRFLGGAAVLARSFARIHETNLKKQGLLPLTFAQAADYERIRETDRISVLGLASLAPGKDLEVELKHAGGKTEKIMARHTLNLEQIEWFKSGSALNLLKKKTA